VLTQLLIQLSPLKLVLFGALFFWASWLATKKILIGSIIGVTLGEATFDSIRSDAVSFGSNPWVVDIANAAGMPIHNGSALSALAANVLLALAMMTVVQALRVYTRARRMDMELECRRHELQRSYYFRAPGEE
jgi:hypothetical protein